MDQEQLAGVVEALIFVSGDPVPLRRLCDILEKPEEEALAAVEELTRRLDERGAAVQVMEVAGGYQIRTRPTYSAYVNRFLERKRKQTLSGAALEAIAIIAYKQPITRAEIEAIRGVGVDGVLKSLMDKRLIKVTGVKEVPGRPNLYGTTKKFLEYFGINSMNDLPPIEDLASTYPSQAGLETLDDHETADADTTPNREDAPSEAAGASDLAIPPDLA